MGKWENILFRDSTAHTSDVFSSSLSLSLCNLFFFSFLNYHRGQFAWEGSLSVKCPSAVQPHLPPDDRTICFWHHSHAGLNPGSLRHLIYTLPPCHPDTWKGSQLLSLFIPHQTGMSGSGWAGLVSGRCTRPKSGAVLSRDCDFWFAFVWHVMWRRSPLVSASWELNNNNYEADDHSCEAVLD